jgi:flagellar biosynthetic protein FliQ
MTPDYVVALGKEALFMALVASAPMLALGLAVGLGVSLLQAITQINDMSVSFIPKIVAAGAGLLYFSPWVLEKLMGFTRAMMETVGSARF